MNHRWFTQNKLICAVIGWYYESHSDWPRRIHRVYGFKEYFTYDGRHVFVKKCPFWRTLYRAIGMIFTTCKKLWDKGEAKLWPEPKVDPRYRGGM